MPIIPEKLASRQDVKSAIACQFWEQPSHSARSIDGQVWSLPCEPPALNLTGSSGLSRTQQLIAAQALGVPAFPSYDASSDGLVLDRVIARLGGKRWWAAIGGRTKVQRMWNHGPGVKGKIHSVRDLDNYGLVARGRFQLGRLLTLNGVVESASVTLLHHHVRHRSAAAAAAVRQRLQGPASSCAGTANGGTSTAEALVVASPGCGEAAPSAAGPSSSLPSPRRSISPAPGTPRSPMSPLSPMSPGGSRCPGRRPGGEGDLFRAHGSLRYSLPGHDLTATAGYHQDYVDCNGEYAHVPLALSLDLASQYRPDGLQYRVGLHQVTAPAIEGSSKAARRLRTTLHIQGAVAVEGEAHIWKPAAPSSSSQAQQQQQQSQQAAAPAGGASAGAGAATAGPAPAIGDAVGSVAQGPAAGVGIATTAGSGGQAEGAGQAKEPVGGPPPSALAAAPAQQAVAPTQQQPQQQQQAPGGTGGSAPASRVATALASAVQADAGPDPASLPPRPGRIFRRKHKAAASNGSGNGNGGGNGGECHEGMGVEEGGQEGHCGQQQGSGAGGESHPGSRAGQAGSTSNGRARGGNRDASGEGPAEGTGAPSSGSSSSGGSSSGALSTEAGGAAGGQGGPGAKLESFIKPLGDLIHTYTHPQQGEGGAPGEGGGGSGGGCGGGKGGGVGEGGGDLLSLSAKSIQAGIQESLALLDQVKESVARLTGEVQEGSLQRMSQQLADSSGRGKEAAPRRRPYSVFLSQPHLKLNGSMGCLARMPLPPLRGFGPPLGGMLGGHPSRAGASSGSLSSLGSVAQAWEPYLKGTSLRLFASGGISGQLGRFTRPFLDYTAVALRADVGLTSPHVVGLLPDPAALDASDAHRPDKHRAFALEGRGSWHSLSASLAQQVFGPVRARADFRFALDPTNMPQNAGERSTIKGLAQTALSVRPSLLEAVFGFDVVLPGTEGAARLACWWSPHRREAMAELRLF